MSDQVDNRFLSRKWALTLAVIVLAVISRAVSWIDGAQFVSLLTWIVGLYMAGNICSAVAGNISINSGPKPTP